MSKRVLFLEDNQTTAEQTLAFLATLELDLSVIHVKNFEDAMSEWNVGTSFDFAIIDVMQDGQPHGLSLVKEIAFRCPCILVSAHVCSIKKAEIRSAGNIRFLERNSKIWDGLASTVKQICTDLDFVHANSHPINVHRARSHSKVDGAVMVTRNWLNPAGKIAPHEMIMEWDFAHLASVASVVEAEVIQEGGQVISMDGVTCLSLFQEHGPDDCLLARALGAAKRIHFELNGNNGGELRPISCGFVEGQVMSGLFGIRQPGISGIVGRTSDVAWQLAMHAKPGIFLCISELLSANSKTHAASKGILEHQLLVGFSTMTEALHIPLD